MESTVHALGQGGEVLVSRQRKGEKPLVTAQLVYYIFAIQFWLIHRRGGRHGIIGYDPLQRITYSLSGCIAQRYQTARGMVE